MRAKIFWTTRECETIARKAIEIRESDASVTDIAAVAQAQKILPLDRQRKHIISRKHAVKVFDAIASLARQPSSIHEKEKLPAAAKVVASLDDLVDALADRFAERISTAIRDHLRQRASSVLQSIVSESSHEDRQRKRSVLIVGPKGDQAAMLEREFGKLLSIRVIDKDQTSRAVLASKSADYVVLWTNFVPHDVQNAINHDKKVYVNGGMDSIRNKLEEIYCL